MIYTCGICCHCKASVTDALKWGVGLNWIKILFLFAVVNWSSQHSLDFIGRDVRQNMHGWSVHQPECFVACCSSLSPVIVSVMKVSWNSQTNTNMTDKVKSKIWRHCYMHVHALMWNRIISTCHVLLLFLKKFLHPILGKSLLYNLGQIDPFVTYYLHLIYRAGLLDLMNMPIFFYMSNYMSRWIFPWMVSNIGFWFFDQQMDIETLKSRLCQHCNR
jgi:hypothetical protein